MNRSHILRATAFVPLVAVLMAAPAAWAAKPAASDDFREISKNFPAADLKRFHVEARVGSVRVRATNTNEVRMKLELEAKREGGWLLGRKGDPHGVELDSRSVAGTLHLTLRGERKGLSEKWVLEVPARLAAEINVEVGDVEARGMEGGARIHVNVGEIDLDVVRGEIDAKVNVGDIRARTASDDYNDVRLEANVGDTDLRVGSQNVPSSHRGYGPGDSARWNGTGRERIRLEVNVGDASLVISKSA